LSVCTLEEIKAVKSMVCRALVAALPSVALVPSIPHLCQYSFWWGCGV